MKHLNVIAITLFALAPGLASAATIQGSVRSIQGFELIDTDSNKAVAVLPVESSTWALDRSTLPSSFNIRILTAPGISTVRTQLIDSKGNKKRDDGSNYQRDDKKAPFAVAGESGGKYAPLILKQNQYSLRVYAYKGSSLVESKSLSLVVNGSVRGPASEPAPQPTPVATPKPAPQPAPSAQGLRVFPGAPDFFGAEAVAGRGGQILKVTNLNDSGEGSLRAATRVSGPKIIVFEVGGTIVLKSKLALNNFTTIAGQSAPSPGITLAGMWGIEANASEVLVQHIRIRIGDKRDGELCKSNCEVDGIAIISYPKKDENGVWKCSLGYPKLKNIVFDHVSIAWAIDGSFDLQALGCEEGISNVTLYQSFITEQLDQSVHAKSKPNARGARSTHSLASLNSYGTKRVSYVGNLWAHTMNRNPRIDENVSAVVMNNYYYNNAWRGIEVRSSTPTQRATCAGQTLVSPTLLSVVGNAIEYGPDSRSTTPLLGIPGGDKTDCSEFNPSNNRKLAYPIAGAGSKFFLQDNVNLSGGPIATSAEQLDASYFPSASPLVLSGFQPKPSNSVKADVLAHSGARPMDRDAVDTRIVKDIISGNRSGHIIDSPDEVGGLPTLKPSYRAFDIENPNAVDPNGYRRIENVLSQMARELEGR
jgi:hypothetical protein